MKITNKFGMSMYVCDCVCMRRSFNSRKTNKHTNPKHATHAINSQANNFQLKFRFTFKISIQIQSDTKSQKSLIELSLPFSYYLKQFALTISLSFLFIHSFVWLVGWHVYQQKVDTRLNQCGN